MHTGRRLAHIYRAFLVAALVLYRQLHDRMPDLGGLVFLGRLIARKLRGNTREATMVEKRTLVCLALTGLVIAVLMPFAVAADGCPPENPNCNIEPPQSIEVNADPLHADGSPIELAEPGMLSPQLIPMPLPRRVDPLPAAEAEGPSFETLPVPMRYQDPDDVTCGVQALGMALSGLGEGAPSSAAIQTFLENNGVMYEFGTGVEELAYAAQSLGYEGSLPFHDWTLDDVRAELSAGRSVVVSLGTNGEGNPGHFVTVTGISPDGQYVAYNDPTSGRETVTVEEFSRLWAMQGNSGVMVRRSIPPGEPDYRPLVAILATLMGIASQTPWGRMRKGIGGRRGMEDRERPAQTTAPRPGNRSAPPPQPAQPRSRPVARPAPESPRAQRRGQPASVPPRSGAAIVRTPPPARPAPRTPPVSPPSPPTSPPQPSPSILPGRGGAVPVITANRRGIDQQRNIITEGKLETGPRTALPITPTGSGQSAPESVRPGVRTLWNSSTINIFTVRGIDPDRERILELGNLTAERRMAARAGVALPMPTSRSAPSAPPPAQPAAKTLWNEHAVNTVTSKGIEQAHVDQTKVDEAHRLSREVIEATGGAKLTLEDLAAIAQVYGVHLERHDAGQLSAALNYINAARTSDQQQERLRKALINLQVLERGMPQLGRQETLDLMWGATMLPGHAVQKMNSQQLAKTFQEVAGAIGQPGQHQLNVGKHVLKMNVSEANTVTSTSTKKPSILSKIGSALKKVGSIALAAASFIPGPVGIVARVAGAVVGAIKGLKERSILGTIAGIAGAVTAGASQLAGKVAQTVSKVGNTVSRVVRGVQSGISAVRNGSVLGAIAGFGSAVAGGLQDLTSKTAETIGRVANTVSRAARGVETAINAARARNPSTLFGAIAGVAGSLAGATANATGRFASTMNQIAVWARRGQSAMDTVSQISDGDFTGALASGTALAAEISGSNGSNGEDEGESVLDQVALWASRANQAVGVVGAIRDGEISQALWSGSAMVSELTKNGDVEDAHQVVDRVRTLETAIRSDNPLAIREAFLGLTDTVRQTVENVRERHFSPETIELPHTTPFAQGLLPIAPTMQAAGSSFIEIPTNPMNLSALLGLIPGLIPQAAMQGGNGAAEFSQEVYIAQTLLNRLEEDLVLDGILGPKTSAALARFQSNHGLEVTGQLDRETMGALVNTFAEIDATPVEGGPFETLKTTQRRAHDMIFIVRDQLDRMPGGLGWSAVTAESELREMVDLLERSLQDSEHASTSHEARDANSALLTIMSAVEEKLREFGVWAEIELQLKDAVRVGLGGVEFAADTIIESLAPPWLKYGYDFAKKTGVSMAEGDGVGWALFKGFSSAGVKRFMNAKFLDPFLKSDTFKKELAEAAVVEMGEAVPEVVRQLSQVWGTDNFQERARQIIIAQAEASAIKLASGLAASKLADVSKINVEEINKELQQSLNVEVSRMTDREKKIALEGLFKTAIFEGIKSFFESALSIITN